MPRSPKVFPLPLQSGNAPAPGRVGVGNAPRLEDRISWRKGGKLAEARERDGQPNHRNRRPTTPVPAWTPRITGGGNNIKPGHRPRHMVQNHSGEAGARGDWRQRAWEGAPNLTVKPTRTDWSRYWPATFAVFKAKVGFSVAK